MIVNESTMADVFNGFKATFLEGVRAAEGMGIDAIAATVPSLGAGESYPVAALLGTMEEVVDEVTIAAIGAWLQSVTNLTFGLAVRVKRNSIEDDNMGIYREAIMDLGRQAALHPKKLAGQAFVSGFADTWVDGQTVFADAHTWPAAEPEAATWNNLEALALTAGNLDTAILNLETRNGPNGERMGLEATHLVCGATMKTAGQDITELEFGTGGASNRRYKLVDLMVLPEITGNQWAVLAAGRVKPLVVQDRSGPELTGATDDSDTRVMLEENFYFKGRRRCNVAILAPWLIQASTGG